MLKYSIICAIILSGITVKAQSDFLGFGFRAGLSFSKIDGPSELGPNNEELEENKLATGFHIGMSINFKFTDIMGLRSELIYSQRGNDYTYNGPSYYLLGRNTLQSVILRGNRNQTINLSNSYLDIPLLGYYKFGYFELSAGLNTGILLSSTAGGNIVFDGTTPLMNTLPTLEINLNYNYKKDGAGQSFEDTQEIVVDGRPYDVPEIVGAYYEYPVKDKDLYKTLDFGLTAGVAYFLNEGLYLSAKYIHGLGDVDRNFYDVALFTDGTIVQRADTNKSTSWQFSIGFSF